MLLSYVFLVIFRTDFAKCLKMLFMFYSRHKDFNFGTLNIHTYIYKHLLRIVLLL